MSFCYDRTRRRVNLSVCTFSMVQREIFNKNDKHLVIYIFSMKSCIVNVHKGSLLKVSSFPFFDSGSFILQAPVATSSTISEYGECITSFATRSGSNAFHIFNTLSMYVLPLAIILICYVKILVQVWRKAIQGTESAQAQERSIRRKRKITRMVFVIVLLFAICWLPTHVFRLWKEFDTRFHMTANNIYFDFANLFALCLVYANSCVNPFVYAFKTTSFKEHFKKLFTSCCHSAQSAMGSVSTFKLSKFTRDDESI